MKNFVKTLMLVVAVMIITAALVYAGPIDWVKGIGKDVGIQLIALLVTAGLGMAGGGVIVRKKLTATMKEGGELIVTLGAALEDNRLTKEEVVDIYKEYKDVVAIWKKHAAA